MRQYTQKRKGKIRRKKVTRGVLTACTTSFAGFAAVQRIGFGRGVGAALYEYERRLSPDKPLKDPRQTAQLLQENMPSVGGVKIATVPDVDELDASKKTASAASDAKSAAAKKGRKTLFHAVCDAAVACGLATVSEARPAAPRAATRESSNGFASDSALGWSAVTTSSLAIKGKSSQYPTMKSTEYEGFVLHTFGVRAAAARTVLYLSRNPLLGPAPEHFAFCQALASRANAMVVMPAFTKAALEDIGNALADGAYGGPSDEKASAIDSMNTPSASALDQIFPRLQRLYMQQYTQSMGRLILAGDGSGGALAVALTQWARDCDVLLPQRVVAISPWIDATLSHDECAAYERKDPILGCASLELIAKTWGGENADLRDPRISPFFGDLSELPPVLVTVGTRELLYPAISDFVEKLYAAGVEVAFEEGTNLLHAYPLAGFREGRASLSRIARFVAGR